MSESLDTATVLLQARNYAGSGNWLDESGNGHDAVATGSPTFDGTKFSYNGSSQYHTVAAHADLDFDTNEDFTLLAWLSIVDTTPAGDQVFVAHKSGAGGSNSAGYLFGNGSGGSVFSRIGDGSSTYLDAIVPTATSGVPLVLVGRRDTASSELTSFHDGNPSGSPATDTNADISSAQPFRIGANSQTTPAEYAACDVYAVALWRVALTDSEIVAVSSAVTVTGGSFIVLGV